MAHVELQRLSGDRSSKGRARQVPPQARHEGHVLERLDVPREELRSKAKFILLDDRQIPHLGSLPSRGQKLMDKNRTIIFEFSAFTSLGCWSLE